MILVSFCRILNSLSDEINLFWCCSSPLSEVQCSKERSRHLKLQLFFKALITQESIIPLHPIDNEQYLGMITITGSLMKTKGMITNISFTFNHTS